MARLLLCAVLLAVLFSLATAAWVIDNTNPKKPHATEGDYKVEVLEIDSDPIYDLGAWTDTELTASLIKDNKEPAETITEATEGAAIETIANKHKLHSSSLNIRVSYKGKTIYGLAEGKVDKDFLKPTLTAIDESVDFAAALTSIRSLSFATSRYTERVKEIEKSVLKMLSEHEKKARADGAIAETIAQKGTLNPTALKTLEVRFKETRAKVGPLMRYYVQVYTGHAFYIPLGGQHSATYVYAVREDNNQVQPWLLEFGNHGRVPTGTGMSYKCTHRGLNTIGRDDPQPAVWDCSTPYFPVWCFWGGRHNCNAGSTFQINISDNPANPPQPNQGICHRACPARAPAC